jgi:hypothetical protein
LRQLQLGAVFAVQRDFTALRLKDAPDQLRKFAVTEDRDSGEVANRNLIQDLASGGKRLYEHSPFVSNARGNGVKILEWQREIFGEGAVVRHDPENGAPGTVRA